MKKKILGACMVACLGLAVAGCAADYDDLAKQTDKMEEIIESGDVFEDDWAMTLTENEEVIFAQRDGDNYYFSFAGEGENYEFWMIKGGNDYTMYGKNEEMKYKGTIPAEEMDDYLLASLESLYIEFVELLKALPEECERDGVACEFDKTLFGKLTINVAEDDASTVIVVKNGKILSIDLRLSRSTMSAEIEYKNQTVKAPADASEYEESPYL